MGMDARGWEGQHHSALFYTDDGIVASSDPGWLQGSLRTLVGLFHQVCLQKNYGKMFRMVLRPCQAVGTQSEAVYNWQMTGAGLSYQDRQRVRVQNSECEEENLDGVSGSPSTDTA